MSILNQLLINSAFKNATISILELKNVRTLKSALKIKWTRPVKKPHIHPLNTGDQSVIPKYDKNTVFLEFQNSEELKSADENVKRIFEIEMDTSLPKLKLYKKELSDRVRRHTYDLRSHEVYIANQTAYIRYLQEHMEQKPKDTKRKVKLQHAIDDRKRQLTHLRRWDYPRFEWLLEKLDIVYRPYPNVYDQITRKKSLTQLTTLHCEEIKEKKLAEFRKKMDLAKVPFLEKKLERLQWIQKEEKELELTPSVKEEDICECEERLRLARLEVASLANKKYLREIHPYTLEKYDAEALRKAEKGSQNV